MKWISQIQSLTALCLILLFSLQAGLGLWLHASLHPDAAGKVAEQKDVPQLSSGAAVSFSCSCLDFLSTVFGQVDAVILPIPLGLFVINEQPVITSNISLAKLSFRSLRAPPAVLA